MYAYTVDLLERSPVRVWLDEDRACLIAKKRQVATPSDLATLSCDSPP
jgi:hypothetical protein